MPIPKYEEIMLPLLKHVAMVQGDTSVPALLPELAREFAMTDDEVQRRLPSGGQAYFANRCHWAKFYLTRAGLLQASRRGYFRISEDGRALLSRQPTSLSRQSLMEIPQFAAWWRQTPEQPEALASERDDGADPEEPSSVTPDEQIDTAAKVLTTALEAELLARVRSVDPADFEQIVVDLLIAMGFGGGDPAMGERLGRSGDGGIDGVIQEDALGLDAVYVQAKRYQDGNNVGAGTIREFVGSLVGNRATKGVFVTASKFTSEARAYARDVQHRIVLMDGEELARLLVRHGVGVREDRLIVIKKLDEDYFSE